MCIHGTGMVVKYTNLYLLRQHPIWPLDHILAAPPPILLPAYAPGKTVEDGSDPWAPAPIWEIQNKFLASGFESAQPQLLWSLGD